MKTKSFDINKREVWESWKVVRGRRGGPGVDGQTLERFERDAGNLLYKLWNRMASGSYMPRAVKRVELPKADGGLRPLGIPCVTDRVAQTVVKRRLEAVLEPVFCADSYGFRPNRSAKQAVMAARRNCWRYAWVVDIDIQSFFDDIDHDLLMRAVRYHVADTWMLLYIERWLKAPVLLADGSMEQRTRGTPQGGVISPLLANLFLHYAFDHWVHTHHRAVVFERYADDIVCHCHTEAAAKKFLATLSGRFRQCGLRLHPRKTRIVYCQDDKRPGKYEHVEIIKAAGINPNKLPPKPPDKLRRPLKALNAIRALYAIERRIRDKPPEERLSVRQAESVPVLDTLRAWLDEMRPKVAPKSKLGEALAYLDNHWQGLTAYCDDGRYHIDNNPVENAIRPFCIGRRGWLFADTPAGATASARLYSLVQTAKANGLEPYAYLRHVFTELPKAQSLQDIEVLLPFNIDPATLRSSLQP